MAHTYEPYEPPGDDAAPHDPGAQPAPQWPLLPDPVESDSVGPASSSPTVTHPYWRTETPSSRRGTVQTVVGVVAAIAIVMVVGATQSDEPAEPDEREQWEECLAEQQGDGGLLEPEEICSITYPDAEDEYGDLGYDNPDDEYGWYVE